MGPELLLTPDFSSSHTDWYGLNASFSSNVCTLENSGPAQLSQLIPPNTNFFEAGKLYRVSFNWKWDDVGGNSIRIRLALSPETSHTFTSSTTEWTTFFYDFLFTAQMVADVTSGGFVFDISGLDAVTSEVKNPSIKELSKNLYLQTVQMVGAQSASVQTINTGKSDDGTPISFEAETQELEFGNRANLKQMANKLTVYTKDAVESSFEGRPDEENYKPIPLDLNQEVNIGKDINLEGNFFTFKWSGVTATTSPVLNGFTIENISNLGITKK